MPPFLQALKVLGPGRMSQLNKVKRLSASYIRGFYVTHVLFALTDVGFFSELGKGPVRVGEFAEKNDLDAAVLQSACDYLYGVGILERSGAGYSLGPDGEMIREFLTGALLSVYAYEDLFHNLEGLLRRRLAYGKEVLRRSKYVAEGSGASARLLAFPLLTAALDEGKYHAVLDLACGDATFLTTLCSQHSGIRGFGVDIAEEAIQSGKRRVADHGLADRIELFVEDMFRIDETRHPLSAVDAVTCVYALHEFLDSDNRRMVDLLGRLRKRFPGVPLFVLEVIRHTPDQLRESPGGVLEIQLVHDLSRQKLATRDEWKSLFHEAGFTRIDESYFSFVRTALFRVS